MNILFISHEASYTGASLYLLSLVKELYERNSVGQMAILLLKDGPIAPELKKYANIYILEWNRQFDKWHLLPNKIGDVLRILEYKAFLNKNSWDIIYANTIISLHKAVEIKQKLRIPLVLHAHESEMLCSRLLTNTEDLNECNKIIAVSSTVVRAILSYGFDKNKISIVPPFSQHLSSEECFRCSIKDNSTFIVGLSGSGCDTKGTDLLPILVHKFFCKYPEADCLFVWVGKSKGSYVSYDAKRLLVEDKIHLIGEVSNPLDYYKYFDVFLLLSREDSFPLVCMETSALAIPTILFDNASGITDMIKHNENGIVVPYLDLDNMADAIYNLYTNPSSRLKLGKKAQDIVLSCYRKEQSLSKIISEIKSIV